MSANSSSLDDFQISGSAPVVTDSGSIYSSTSSLSSFDSFSTTSGSYKSGYEAKLAEFHNEMQRLDVELTKEYRMALEQVPDIVAIESDPLKHLRVEDGDAQRAATRVAQYWKQRRQYFDESERWLRPMTQTEGSGALSRQDIAVLRSGYLSLVTLPSSGLQVLLIDPMKITQDPGRSRERCLFYLCTHEIKERSTRTGLEILFLLTSRGFASERHTELINVLYGALPTKVRHLTIVQSAQDGRQELLDFLAFRLEKTFEFFTPTRVTVVRATSRSVVWEALERRGISARYVPKQLGGDYNYAPLPSWVTSRLAVENAMVLPARNVVPPTFRKPTNHKNSKLLAAKQYYAPSAAGNSLVKSDLTSILWNERHKKNGPVNKRKCRKIKRSSGTKFPISPLAGSDLLSEEETNERLKAIIANVLDTSLSDFTF